MREKLIKRMKTGYNTGVALLVLAGLTAKIRKDIRTHTEHKDHDPCKCYPQCLGCLVD